MPHGKHDLVTGAELLCGIVYRINQGIGDNEFSDRDKQV